MYVCIRYWTGEQCVQVASHAVRKSWVSCDCAFELYHISLMNIHIIIKAFNRLSVSSQLGSFYFSQHLLSLSIGRLLLCTVSLKLHIYSIITGLNRFFTNASYANTSPFYQGLLRKVPFSRLGATTYVWVTYVHTTTLPPSPPVTWVLRAEFSD